MNSKIFDTQLTGNYLSKCFQETFGSEAILKAIKPEKIAIGSGFSSSILKITLIWESKLNDLPEGVVVKVPSAESLSKIFDRFGSLENSSKTKKFLIERIHGLHESECNFYKIFRTGQHGIPMPKCFYGKIGDYNEPGILILEDLSPWTTTPSLITGLSMPQLMESISSIAKLHGWSLCNFDKWQKLIKPVDHMRSIIKPLFDLLHPGFEIMKNRYPNYFGDIDVDKLCRFLTFDHLSEISSLHKPLMNDVIVHGDLWINNLLFANEENAREAGDHLVAIVDFQRVSRGNPMADLGRLMSINVSQEIRRNHMDEILNCYYENFISMLDQDDVHIPPITEFQHWYDLNFAFFTIEMLVNFAIFDGFSQCQNEHDETILLKRMKAAYDDAMPAIHTFVHET